jgi:hypothetical protein
VVVTTLACMAGDTGWQRGVDSLLDHYALGARLGQPPEVPRRAEPGLRLIPYLGYDTPLSTPIDGFTRLELSADTPEQPSGYEYPVTRVRLKGAPSTSAAVVERQVSAALGTAPTSGCSGSGSAAESVLVWRRSGSRVAVALHPGAAPPRGVLLVIGRDMFGGDAGYSEAPCVRGGDRG